MGQTTIRSRRKRATIALAAVTGVVLSLWGAGSVSAQSPPVDPVDTTESTGEQQHLEGLLHVVVVEPNPNARGGEHSGSEVEVTLVTENGRVPLSGELVENAVSGMWFSGVVDESLEVVAADIQPPVAAAVASKVHSLDVIYLAPSGYPVPPESAVNALTARMNEYWPAQTNRQISGVVRTTSYRTARVSQSIACDANAAWEYAAGPSGFNRPGEWGADSTSYYWGASRAAHLVVLVPEALCGFGGLGTLSAIHTGGTVWATVEATTESTDWDGTVYHEFGHNLGLGHSNARVCTTEVSDGPTCDDHEYNDYFDVMSGGMSVSDTLTNSRNISALSVTHRAQLDALPRGSALAEARVYNGFTQTYTLKPISDSTGLRGVEIVDPLNQERLYIEYRSGTGRDANAFYTRLSADPGWAAGSWVRPGVRVMKLLGCTLPAPTCTNASSVALQRPQTYATDPYGEPRASLSFLSGDTFVSASKSSTYDGVRVRVVSTSPSQAVIQVTFDVRSPIFRDVSGTRGAWNFSAFDAEIRWMFAQGITTGYDVPGAKEYRPFASVNRDAMAAFLYRAAKSPAYPVPAVSKFVDVPTSHPFYKEISWLADSGVSTGWDVGGGKKQFRPSEPIGRDAMAAFLYRFAAPTGFTPPPRSAFTDVSTTQPFYREISWLAQSGVSTGWDVGGGRKEFRPYQPISRDAMAAFLFRFSRLPV